MKRRKALCVGGAVLLFGIAAVVFIKFYPTLQLYFMAEQTDQQVITVTDPDGNEKQVLGVENYTEQRSRRRSCRKAERVPVIPFLWKREAALRTPSTD